MAEPISPLGMRFAALALLALLALLAAGLPDPAELPAVSSFAFLLCSLPSFALAFRGSFAFALVLAFSAFDFQA